MMIVMGYDDTDGGGNNYCDDVDDDDDDDYDCDADGDANIDDCDDDGMMMMTD